MSDETKVQCEAHGEAFVTFVCQHIASDTATSFLSDEEPTPEEQWPDAFCAGCDATMKAAGGWTDAVEQAVGVTVLCHRCYEARRARLRAPG